MRGAQGIFVAKKPISGRYSGALSLVVAALFGVVVSAFGAEMPSPSDVSLTETEALRLGLSRSGLQEALEGEIGLARSDALEASLWPNPVASYAREEISDEALGSTEDFAWLTQQFDLSGRRRLRTKAAEHRVQAVTCRTESQRLEIEAEIRRRFYEVLQRQELVDAVEKWSSRMETIAETVVKRERGGEVSGYDRRRLERERASTRARLRVERAAFDRAREQLAAILGESTERRAGWPKVVGDLLPVSHPRPIDDLLAELSTRPDLQAHDQTVAAADLDNRAAGRWWFPELTLGGGVKSVDAGGDHANGFLVSASIPLPLLDRNRDETLRAVSQARIARGRRSLNLAEASGEVRGLWIEATQLASAARQVRDEAVGLSSGLIQTAEAAYRAGEIGILELLDAYRSAFDAERQALELEMSARQARVDLDRLTGGGSR